MEEIKNDMKNTIFIVLLFIGNFTYSQQVKQTIILKKIEPKIIYDNLFNLETGEKISKKEFELLVKTNGNIKIETFYDKYGTVEKRYYNPKPAEGERRNSINKKPEKGESFPDFIFETIDNKKIELDNFKGKLVIISFGLINDNVLANKREIIEIDSKIKASNRSAEIESILLFRESKEEIMNVFDLNSTNFKIIPNGEGFINKWNILRFPTTIIIDKDGKFRNNFQWYEINISELLNL